MAFLAMPLDAQADGLFVGEVAGTGALIALAVDDGRVEAYLCDGTDDGVSIWAWLAGDLGGEATHLTAANGVVVSFTGADPLSGEVVLKDGTVTSFAAALATGGAGWWVAEGDVAGQAARFDWIRLADGRATGTRSRTSGPVTSIKDGTSNITDGTSNISDGTSNITSASLTLALGNDAVLDLGVAQLALDSMAVD